MFSYNGIKVPLLRKMNFLTSKATFKGDHYSKRNVVLYAALPCHNTKKDILLQRKTQEGYVSTHNLNILIK